MHVINAMISKLKYRKKSIFFWNWKCKKRVYSYSGFDKCNFFFIDRNRIFNPIINIGVGYDITIKI